MGGEGLPGCPPPARGSLAGCLPPGGGAALRAPGRPRGSPHPSRPELRARASPPRPQLLSPGPGYRGRPRRAAGLSGRLLRRRLPGLGCRSRGLPGLRCRGGEGVGVRGGAGRAALSPSRPHRSRDCCSWLRLRCRPRLLPGRRSASSGSPRPRPPPPPRVKEAPAGGGRGPTPGGRSGESGRGGPGASPAAGAHPPPPRPPGTAPKWPPAPLPAAPCPARHGTAGRPYLSCQRCAVLRPSRPRFRISVPADLPSRHAFVRNLSQQRRQILTRPFLRSLYCCPPLTRYNQPSRCRDPCELHTVLSHFQPVG